MRESEKDFLASTQMWVVQGSLSACMGYAAFFLLISFDLFYPFMCEREKGTWEEKELV